MDSRYRDEHTALLAKQAALEDEIARLKAENAAQREPPTAEAAPARRPLGLPHALLAAFMLIATGVLVLAMSPRKRRPAPPPPHAILAHWDAKVTNATGAAGVAAGTPCTIGARLEYVGETLRALRDTVVTCAGVEIYSERGVHAAGSTGFREMTYEAARKGDRYDFLLDEHGVATRTHPHASIDTARGIGLIAGEAPRMSVDLAIVPGSRDAQQK